MREGFLEEAELELGPRGPAACSRLPSCIGLCPRMTVLMAGDSGLGSADLGQRKVLLRLCRGGPGSALGN